MKQAGAPRPAPGATVTVRSARPATGATCAVIVAEQASQAADGRGRFSGAGAGGLVLLKTDTPPPDLADDVRRAVALCPARALTLSEQ